MYNVQQDPVIAMASDRTAQTCPRSRAARFSQAELARAIKGAQKANLNIAAVRVEPDGTILIIPGTPETIPSPKRNPWDPS
jgi:hypothetical protein